MQKVIVRKDGSIDVQEIGFEESLTDQQYKEECDINNIMRKYAYNSLPHPSRGFYADLSEVKDYAESLQIVKKAEDAFMQLDPRVRAQFENDPTKLISFLSDSKNADEAVRLGLAHKPTKSDTQQIIEKLESLAPKS